MQDFQYEQKKKKKILQRERNGPFLEGCICRLAWVDSRTLILRGPPPSWISELCLQGTGGQLRESLSKTPFFLSLRSGELGALSKLFCKELALESQGTVPHRVMGKEGVRETPFPALPPPSQSHHVELNPLGCSKQSQRLGYGGGGSSYSISWREVGALPMPGHGGGSVQRL